jgi:hypothetical protein
MRVPGRNNDTDNRQETKNAKGNNRRWKLAQRGYCPQLNASMPIARKQLRAGWHGTRVFHSGRPRWPDRPSSYDPAGIDVPQEAASNSRSDTSTALVPSRSHRES